MSDTKKWKTLGDLRDIANNGRAWFMEYLSEDIKEFIKSDKDTSDKAQDVRNLYNEYLSLHNKYSEKVRAVSEIYRSFQISSINRNKLKSSQPWGRWRWSNANIKAESNSKALKHAQIAAADEAIVAFDTFVRDVLKPQISELNAAYDAYIATKRAERGARNRNDPTTCGPLGCFSSSARDGGSRKRLARSKRKTHRRKTYRRKTHRR